MAHGMSINKGLQSKQVSLNVGRFTLRSLRSESVGTNIAETRARVNISYKL